MVEFRTEYYTPMDRGYHERAEVDPVRPTANIEEPIIPVAQLGQTVPEHDPSGRHKNILQNVQAAIRGGTGSLQIVMQTPIDSPIGGRPKAYGEEVRQAMREVALANEVMVTGIEMPTSLSNMSGWDSQRGVVDEGKRQRELDEVKETLRFAAEVGQGGGVDIVSFEYNRPAFRQDWFQEDKTAQEAFKDLKEQEGRFEEIRFVDDRSGQINPIPIREGIWVFRDKDDFDRLLDPLSEDEEKRKPQQWRYNDFKKYAKYLQEHKAPEGTSDYIKGELKKDLNTEDLVRSLIKDHFIDTQRGMAEAQAGYYLQHLSQTRDQIVDIKAGKYDDKLKTQQQKDSAIDRLRQVEESELEGIKSQKRVVEEHIARLEHWQPMEKYTLDKSKQGYAEAGISAMQLQDKMGPKKIKEDLYVGPEIGWPQFYGSHPKEFVDIIQGARDEMIAILTDREKSEKFGLKPMSRSAARDEAEHHIKGMFDTSHLGMWLQNFHPELPWDERKKKFTKWYGEQIDWLAKENRKHNLIGGIQAVDSAGGGHGHLPPGQGILPVKDAVEKLRTKGGFSGYVVSEGHEEEKFGEGRITLKTWQHFNAPIGAGYSAAAGGAPPQRWGEIQHGYFGRTYSPLFMFGSYAPSNEFKLWSEVPLE